MENNSLTSLSPGIDNSSQPSALTFLESTSHGLQRCILCIYGGVGWGGVGLKPPTMRISEQMITPDAST